MGENAPWDKMPPYCISQNNRKIKSRYIFIVTMDYVDESDVEVFTTSTGDVNDQIFSSQKKSVLKLVVL